MFPQESRSFPQDKGWALSTLTPSSSPSSDPFPFLPPPDVSPTAGLWTASWSGCQLCATQHWHLQSPPLRAVTTPGPGLSHHPEPRTSSNQSSSHHTDPFPRNGGNCVEAVQGRAGRGGTGGLPARRPVALGSLLAQVVVLEGAAGFPEPLSCRHQPHSRGLHPRPSTGT